MASSLRGRRGGARLHLAGDPAIERRHGDRHLDEAAACHAGEDVKIARDERGLGDDADGMVGAVQNLQHRAGYSVLALDRLIGIGDGAQGDEFRHIARIAELPLQQLGGVDLGVKLGLEIEPGGVAKVAMRRPGKAVDAAVLAAAIGIDGLLEADVRAVVAGDDALGHLAIYVGLERRKLRQAFPAVVEGLAQLAFEAPDTVGARPAAATQLRLDNGAISPAALVRHRHGLRKSLRRSLSQWSVQNKNIVEDLWSRRRGRPIVGRNGGGRWDTHDLCDHSDPECGKMPVRDPDGAGPRCSRRADPRGHRGRWRLHGSHSGDRRGSGRRAGACWRRTRQSAGGGGSQGALSLAAVSSCRYSACPRAGSAKPVFSWNASTPVRARPPPRPSALRSTTSVQDRACWSGWWRFAALH